MLILIIAITGLFNMTSEILAQQLKTPLWWYPTATSDIAISVDGSHVAETPDNITLYDGNIVVAGVNVEGPAGIYIFHQASQ